MHVAAQPATNSITACLQLLIGIKGFMVAPCDWKEKPCYCPAFALAMMQLRDARPTARRHVRAATAAPAR
jgi:hypothetical protein